MSQNSDIEWTDATWNPVRGCVKVSPGCKFCYALTFAERFRGVAGHPYEQGFDPRLVPEQLDAPLRWKKPRTIFVNSMSDLFMADVPDDYLAACFGVMAASARHTYQVLTKRADRLPRFMEWLAREAGGRERWRAAFKLAGVEEIKMGFGALGARIRPPEAAFGLGIPWPLPNVWLGVSVETQRYAHERIPRLLATPAAVRFLSIEPLLGPVDLSSYLARDEGGACSRCGCPWSFVDERATFPHPSGHACPPGYGGHLGWVIVGGESGPGAREMRIEWVRDIVKQCRAAGVPVFVKQLGARPMIEDANKLVRLRLHRTNEDGKRVRDAKGKAIEEWPTDLRVREMPVRTIVEQAR